MVDLCHWEDFELAWDGSGFCNRWLKNGSSRSVRPRGFAGRGWVR